MLYIKHVTAAAEMAVWEHGGGGEEAEGNGNGVQSAEGSGGRNRNRSTILPRPRRLHDRGLQLRQPSGRPAHRTDGPELFQTQSPDKAAVGAGGKVRRTVSAPL